MIQSATTVSRRRSWRRVQGRNSTRLLQRWQSSSEVDFAYGSCLLVPIQKDFDRIYYRLCWLSWSQIKKWHLCHLIDDLWSHCFFEFRNHARENWEINFISLFHIYETYDINPWLKLFHELWRLWFLHFHLWRKTFAWERYMQHSSSHPCFLALLISYHSIESFTLLGTFYSSHKKS